MRLCHDSRAVPTYDYGCRSCGAVTEVIHSMLEDGPTVCEQCGGELRRILYPAGIIFKGSGFYKTDSRNSGSTASADGGNGRKTDATDGKASSSTAGADASSATSSSSSSASD